MSIRSNAAFVAAGLFVGVAALSLMSQSGPGGLPLEFVASPRNFVQISGSAPYVVPPGRAFVLTALGSAEAFSSSPQQIYFAVNGVRECQAKIEYVGTNTTMAEVPKGLAVQPGSTITLAFTGLVLTSPRAWGYLYP